jgi:hypothetical protein
LKNLKNKLFEKETSKTNLKKYFKLLKKLLKLKKIPEKTSFNLKKL